MLRRKMDGWVSLVLCALIFTASFAEAKGKPPNVMVLATGRTIAGTGATSMMTIGYTARHEETEAQCKGCLERDCPF